MEQLESAFRAAGITVPFISNEKGQRSESWSTDYQDVGGAVDIYGKERLATLWSTPSRGTFLCLLVLNTLSLSD